jgi:two-component system, cell cycle response regulator
MNKHLLVVDDSQPIHTLVKSVLADDPIEVHSATKSPYGLTLAASLKPDLILLDVDMPEIDGFEFCRRMKADANLWSVPVIFLTSKSETGDKVHGLEMGAADYITKPFEPAELQARVHASLRIQKVIKNLEDSSLVDTLTGFGNRKLFNQRLSAEVSVRARAGRPLTVSFIDVDGFSTINNCYGQSFGDGVLTSVAHVIREAYRPEDALCRLAGDDFAVLMPDTTMDQAIAIAARVKTGLSKARFSYRDSVIPVTCCIGIAEAGDPYDRTMLDRAIASITQSSKRTSNGLFLSMTNKSIPAEKAA